MSNPPSVPTESRSNRRVIAIAAAIVLIALIVLGVLAIYLFFFGSDAPDAPTLDDALQVLLPSASPA